MIIYNKTIKKYRQTSDQELHKLIKTQLDLLRQSVYYPWTSFMSVESIIALASTCKDINKSFKKTQKQFFGA